jgi:hypothetical protein
MFLLQLRRRFQKVVLNAARTVGISFAVPHKINPKKGTIKNLRTLSYHSIRSVCYDKKEFAGPSCKGANAPIMFLFYNYILVRQSLKIRLGFVQRCAAHFTSVRLQLLMRMTFSPNTFLKN